MTLFTSSRSGHLSAHVLAEIAKGAAPRAEHLRDCQECQARLERIESVRSAMDEISDLGVPKLNYEHIAARVYWSTSAERRRKKKATRKPARAVLIAGCAVAAVAGSIALWQWSAHKTTGDEHIAARTVSQKSASTDPSVASLRPLHGFATLFQGQILVNAKALGMDSAIVAGDTLSVGEGLAVVQFGTASALRVAEDSSVHFARFDSESIELEIDGLVDVDIPRRLPGQRFVIRAGDQQVVVRGTAFRTNFRDGTLEVQCTRGKVAVTDGRQEVQVPAGQEFRVRGADWTHAQLRVLPIPVEKLAALDEAMNMHMVQGWTSEGPSAGAILELNSPQFATVELDGLSLGSGAFFARAMPGAHDVVWRGEDGKELGSESAQVSVNERTRFAGVFSKPQERPRAESDGRRIELQKQIAEDGQARRCLAVLEKQGLVEGSYIAFELGVTSEGLMEFLNIADSNLSPSIQTCFQRAVERVTLDTGPRARFRLRLSY